MRVMQMQILSQQMVTHPMLKTVLHLPVKQTPTTLPGVVVEAVVGVVVGVMVVVVGDKAIKDVMKQPVHLQKRDGQRVAVCNFSLSQ